jgi:two-component system, response regulator PdtaR
MHAARVLLAQPDAPVRSVLVGLLEAAGFVVLHTATHPTQPPPDIAVVWLTTSTPGQACEGLGVAQALTQAHIPFIAVAPDTGDTLRRVAIELGAIGYVIQPVDANVLVPLIRAGLQWFAKWRRLGEEHRALLEALVESRSIGTAVGIIAERHQLTPQCAFERLRRKARDERRTVADLAAGVVTGAVDLPDRRCRHVAGR